MFLRGRVAMVTRFQVLINEPVLRRCNHFVTILEVDGRLREKHLMFSCNVYVL
jgi:hypothetical protein